jgi:hypothetical protein
MVITNEAYDKAHPQDELLVVAYSDGTGENDLVLSYSDGTGENDLVVAYGDE